MTILRVGSTEKYSEGWDQVFGKRRTKAVKAAGKRPVKKKTKKSGEKK